MIQMNFEESSSEQKEFQWLLNCQTVGVYRQIQSQLTKVLKVLPSKERVSASDDFSKPEKWSVSSTQNDNMRCILTLLGDNIIQAEVNTKYTKAPGHVYRAVAQPDVQWKLLQVQDVINYTRKSLTLVQSIIDFFEYKRSLGAKQVIANMAELMDVLKKARLSLVMPRKRSIAELKQNRILRCFTPALPNDLAVSIYISSYKLICASYQTVTLPASSTGAAKHQLIVNQGECVVPWLEDTLILLNNILQLCQHFENKLVIFKRL